MTYGRGRGKGRLFPSVSLAFAFFKCSGRGVTGIPLRALDESPAKAGVSGTQLPFSPGRVPFEGQKKVKIPFD